MNLTPDPQTQDRRTEGAPAPVIEQDVEYTPQEQDLAPKDIQEQVEEHEKERPAKFGTFGGVFTPTLLTILGVIMYLREGWVVGNAGLGGALLIILLSFTITGCTGLSMSSFVTNIRVGAGGAFSMISQSLGLEVGGAVGVPLFISQALAVTMYIFGFRAGWLAIPPFAGHPPLIIDLAVFALIFGIAFVSTGLAFRVQYVILAIIIGSLISVALAAFTGSMQYPVTWWGEFPGAPEEGFPGITFWGVFAVFFPAATGIMAGANMSGDLENPRRSIPIGTMAAIGLSLVIYLGLAYWLARSATVDELTSNYTIMVDRAFWPPAVLAGLLAATFSSALASFVGAPRILQALGGHSILPAGGWLSRQSASNEPRNATYITAILVLASLMLRNLNAIAPLISMIFLITYATINLVVLVEQSLGLLSFRPLMRIPRVVPLLGLIGCVFVMFIINPVVSLVAAGLIVALYFVLVNRRLKAPFGDVRSGLFVAVAEWAAKRARLARSPTERAWKPNILLPTDDAKKVRGVFRLVYHLAYPVGSVKLLGIAPGADAAQLEVALQDSAQALQEEGVFASASAVAAESFPHAVVVAIQALSGTFFRPNLLFLELPGDPLSHAQLNDVIREAQRQRLGVAIMVEHPHARLGRRHTVNLWLPDQGPEWDIQMKFENLDLSILLAYRIMDSWHADLNVILTVREEKDQERAEQFLNRLVDLARLPARTRVYVAQGDFRRYTPEAPQADLNL
ncbi:MAG TPA: amino acid permease, partial [Chloroflexota bacterium]|nr:amino acid permease [Chloroflexota bacterium]